MYLGLFVGPVYCATQSADWLSIKKSGDGAEHAHVAESPAKPCGLLYCRCGCDILRFAGGEGGYFLLEGAPVDGCAVVQVDDA